MWPHCHFCPCFFPCSYLKRITLKINLSNMENKSCPGSEWTQISASILWRLLISTYLFVVSPLKLSVRAVNHRFPKGREHLWLWAAWPSGWQPCTQQGGWNSMITFCDSIIQCSYDDRSIYSNSSFISLLRVGGEKCVSLTQNAPKVCSLRKCTSKL